MTHSTTKERFLNIGSAVLSIGAFILVWHLSVLYTGLGQLLPGPAVVVKVFIQSLSTPIGKYNLIRHTIFSLFRVFVGFSLGAVIGVVLGIAMGRSPLIDAIIRPIFNLVRPIPGITWIPMAILWFGIGETTKYFIIFMGGFANVLLNTYAGAKSTDTELIGAARMLGANNNQVFRYVVLPGAIPYIFAGLQISLSTSWMAVLAAEMVAATEGVGYLINAGMNSGNTTQILIGMIAIGIVGFSLAQLMRFLEGRLCSWQVRGE